MHSSFWGCGKFLGVSDEKPSAANRQRDRGADRKELSAKSDGTKWKRSLAGLPRSKLREFRRGLLRREHALIGPGRLMVGAPCGASLRTHVRNEAKADLYENPPGESQQGRRAARPRSPEKELRSEFALSGIYSSTAIRPLR